MSFDYGGKYWRGNRFINGGNTVRRFLFDKGEINKQKKYKNITF